jgi:hypothetical protein
MGRMLTTDISALKNVQRGEVILKTDLTYDGIRPVCVRATKREGRFEFSDDGGAVVAAGTDGSKFTFPGSIVVRDCSVNLSREGVVWLPASGRSSSQWLDKLPELVVEGSLARYGALLELED